MKAKKSPKSPAGSVSGKPRKGGKQNARRKKKAPPSVAELRAIHLQAAGIDVGAQEHYVAVPPHSVPAGERAVRSFCAFTHGLDDLVDWLKQCGVTTVAMESTGVYWIPLFQKLAEAGLECVLANAAHVRNVPGRKTDVQDCQWLQQLHSHGLVSGSFRPDDEICKLRSLQRHRGNIVSNTSAAVQHMQRALQEMNVHLHHVVSDLQGKTGQLILDAILAGERDPKKLVKLRDSRISKSSVPEMEQALHGDYRPEHLFVLRQSLETFRFHFGQLERCDQEIETVLEKLAGRAQEREAAAAALTVPADGPPESPTGGGATTRAYPLGAIRPGPEDPAPGSTRTTCRRGKKPVRHAPPSSFQMYLKMICGVDLTAICGLNLLSVAILISEIGTDMSRWRNAKAFCSWLGLCPGNKISGGKVLSSRSRRVVNRAATILRIAASTLSRSDCCLGHFYRRKKTHLGPAKAITATARKLACLVYYMLKYKQEYREPDPATYQAKVQKCQLIHLQRKAAKLGFDLVATPTANA